MRRDLAALLLLVSLAQPTSARDVPGFGSVAFPTSCAPAVAIAFETAVARLHAFDGPEDAFKSVAAADPRCAMTWWGGAMAVRGNPLAGAPDEASLKAGRAYVAKARAAWPATPREAGLIDAMGVYYREGAQSHEARTRSYEAAMHRLVESNPDDVEVQSFAALATLEAVDLTDKTYARQREAGRVLERLWATHPDHPGAPHYLIHAYDYAPLAAGALDAARRYAAIAPASMHAQHMPSHIYSMLGLWRDSIAANRAAADLGTREPGPAAGRAPSGGYHRHHDAHARPSSQVASARLDAADPHGMDFIAYAHLQLGQDRAVQAALDRAAPSEERTLVEARFLLERADWARAARMPLGRTDRPLDAVTRRFVRALGAARTGQVARARDEAAALRRLRDAVERAEGPYWAGLVDVYAGAAEAWTARDAGRPDEALRLMREAADRDDAREKHILLENKLLPIRELYGELLLEAGRAADALAAFDASLVSAPNRFRSLLGAARAAKALGRDEDSRRRYGEAASLTAEAAPGRLEIDEVRRLRAVPG